MSFGVFVWCTKSYGSGLTFESRRLLDRFSTHYPNRPPVPDVPPQPSRSSDPLLTRPFIPPFSDRLLELQQRGAGQGGQGVERAGHRRAHQQRRPVLPPPRVLPPSLRGPGECLYAEPSNHRSPPGVSWRCPVCSLVCCTTFSPHVYDQSVGQSYPHPEYFHLLSEDQASPGAFLYAAPSHWCMVHDVGQSHLTPEYFTSLSPPPPRQHRCQFPLGSSINWPTDDPRTGQVAAGAECDVDDVDDADRTPPP
jgi:hypothetical protein